MLRTNLTISAMLLAGAVSAQTQSSTVTAATDTSAPVLVSSVAPETNDSPLVLAAKRAVAARHRVTVKIDNDSVRKATKLLTTTDNARTIPKFPPAEKPQPQQQPPVVASVPTKAEPPKAEARRPMSDSEALYETGEEAPGPAPANKGAKPPATKPKP